jgi:hypothetical protein
MEACYLTYVHWTKYAKSIEKLKFKKRDHFATLNDRILKKSTHEPKINQGRVIVRKDNH